MKRIALLALLLSSSCPDLFAQEATLSSRAGLVTVPTRRFALDYRTRTLREVDGAAATGMTSEGSSLVAYDNSCTSGFFLLVDPGEEVVDWGDKTAGLSTFVTGFSFGYATAEPDASIGGVGASLEIAFFSETRGFGILGSEVARFTFSGLPGDTTGSGIGAYVIDVDLTGGGVFCLPDGDIGYSTCSHDLAGTGPLIGDIAACPAGQNDAFDVYACGADEGGYAGTFFFGGTPTATFSMRLDEDDGTDVATTAANVGSGLNADLLTDGGTPPILGATWPLMHTEVVQTHTVSTALWYAGSLPPGTLVLSNGLGDFEVIVDPTSTFGLSRTVPFVAGLGADHTILLPKDTNLLGRAFTVQAVAAGGGQPFALSTALDITVGF